MGVYTTSLRVWVPRAANNVVIECAGRPSGVTFTPGLRKGLVGILALDAGEPLLAFAPSRLSSSNSNGARQVGKDPVEGRTQMDRINPAGTLPQAVVRRGLENTEEVSEAPDCRALGIRCPGNTVKAKGGTVPSA
ncbi:MAG: hypothetical protein OXC57_12310 [Rhodobacteraceae bacterium]|nr:hypothetical protein [Paracoccaceae bacterium]